MPEGRTSDVRLEQDVALGAKRLVMGFDKCPGVRGGCEQKLASAEARPVVFVRLLSNVIAHGPALSAMSSPHCFATR